MNAKKLRSLVDEIMWDIEFDYLGKHGAICCFAEDIAEELEMYQEW